MPAVVLEVAGVRPAFGADPVEVVDAILASEVSQRPPPPPAPLTEQQLILGVTYIYHESQSS